MATSEYISTPICPNILLMDFQIAIDVVYINTIFIILYWSKSFECSINLLKLNVYTRLYTMPKKVIMTAAFLITKYGLHCNSEADSVQNKVGGYIMTCDIKRLRDMMGTFR